MRYLPAVLTLAACGPASERYYLTTTGVDSDCPGDSEQPGQGVGIPAFENGWAYLVFADSGDSMTYNPRDGVNVGSSQEQIDDAVDDRLTCPATGDCFLCSVDEDEQDFTDSGIGAVWSETVTLNICPQGGFGPPVTGEYTYLRTCEGSDCASTATADVQPCGRVETLEGELDPVGVFGRLFDTEM